MVGKLRKSTLASAATAISASTVSGTLTPASTNVDLGSTGTPFGTVAAEWVSASTVTSAQITGTTVNSSVLAVGDSITYQTYTLEPEVLISSGNISATTGYHTVSLSTPTTVWEYQRIEFDKIRCPSTPPGAQLHRAQGQVSTDGGSSFIGGGTTETDPYLTIGDRQYFDTKNIQTQAYGGLSTHWYLPLLFYPNHTTLDQGTTDDSNGFFHFTWTQTSNEATKSRAVMGFGRGGSAWETLQNQMCRDAVGDTALVNSFSVVNSFGFTLNRSSDSAGPRLNFSCRYHMYGKKKR